MLLEVELLSTGKTNRLKQEIYANLTICNIAALFKHLSDYKIDNELKRKSLKYSYQTNRSYLLGGY
ncbi:MAG: hypothetical protein LBV03_08940 [Fusobacteriales bacterium]|jgi:hypothetical protein|nr:hypothetical protein [Fusobacteriales bacterium]